MKYPKISVIVPSYNQVDFLELTLRSVIDQKYPNVELIVIDGASNDGSIDILKKYDEYITFWVAEKDEGQTDALIKGFNKSTGEIQCWLNSDDLHEPDTLLQVAGYFNNKPDIDAVFGSTIWIDSEGKPLRIHHEMPFNKFIWLHTYNYIPGMSMFWRRSIYERSGGLDSKFNLAMDADLWSRFSAIGKIGHVREVWSRMRFYPEQKNRLLRDASNIEDEIIRTRAWGTDNPRFLFLKRKIAHTLRVLWKFFTGCYPLGYSRYLEKNEVK
ncbi:MAG: glycosyltransferase family 2 protein [Methylococcales bacterium]